MGYASGQFGFTTPYDCQGKTFRKPFYERESLRSSFQTNVLEPS